MVKLGFGLFSKQGPLEPAALPARVRRGPSFGDSIARVRPFVPSRLESVDDIEPVCPKLAPALSWGYQLQNIDAGTVKNFDGDVVVIDSSPDGDAANAFTAGQVEAMKQRNSRQPKSVISYMSIGEANTCRAYWRKDWVNGHTTTAHAPRWLHKPNGAGWTGAWIVKFWEQGWQDLIINNADSELNRIIDSGFDGVYLDIIDGYIYWSDSDLGPQCRPRAGNEMVTFVRRIAHHARVKRGKANFAVIPQNGEGLLRDPRYRAVISAVGKEDILFKMAGQANAKPKVAVRAPLGEDSVETVMSHVRLALADHIPVLAVEYLLDWPKDAPLVPQTVKDLRAMGLVPHVAVRLLDQLSPPVHPPGQQLASAQAPAPRQVTL